MAKGKQDEAAKDVNIARKPQPGLGMRGGQSASLANALRAPGRPAAALHLQRVAGNRATGQAVQRAQNAAPAASAEPGSGLQGGEVGSEISTSLDASKHGGARLDPNVGGDIGGKMGADFSNVRVHTDSGADSLSRSLNAKAFTHGSDVYFSSGSYSPGTSAGKQLLAHELTHVVQQSGGGGGVSRKARVQAKLTVGAVDDPYEREADAMANKVMRSSGLQRSPAAGTPIKIQRMTRGVAVQRWFGKKDPEEEKKKAAKAKAKNDEQDLRLTEGAQFERNLGKYVFNHSLATAAAQKMGDKMKAAMFPEFKEDEEGQKDEFAKAFGGKATKYAGNVGQTWDAVSAVFKEGNLRERMTALYNAMFGKFKETVKGVVENQNWDDAEKRGLDVRKMKIRSRQLKWNPGVKDVYRDPRGGLLDSKKSSSFDMDLLARGTRTQLPGDNITTRKVGELEEGPHKAGLSEREKAHMYADKGGADVSGETLPWEEGGSKWKGNDKSAWIKKSRNSLKMPVFGGPSGTALRFYQIYEWLGKPMPVQDLRLALLGWMLVENDHSFHEIMTQGENYGLPHAGGQESYRNITPLSVMDLRKNVCLDAKYPGLFPDEVAYHRKLDAGSFALMKPYKDTMDEGASYSKLAGKDFRMNKAKYEATGLQTMMRSATGYTLLAYQIQNMVADSKPFVAKMRINMLLKDVKKWAKEWADDKGKTWDEKDPVAMMDIYNGYAGSTAGKGLNFAQKNILFVLTDTPDITAEQLIEETKDHNVMTRRAMTQLPRYKGKLYRGEAGFMKRGYKQGTSFTVKKFMSAAVHSDGAVFYANQSAGKKEGKADAWYTKYMKQTILELDVTSARDITAVSGNEEEDVRNMDAEADTAERVLLPGTRLKVESAPEVEEGKYSGIPVIKLKEVATGSDAALKSGVDTGGGSLEPDQEFEPSPSLPLYQYAKMTAPTGEGEATIAKELMDERQIKLLRAGKIDGEWMEVIDPSTDYFWVKVSDWAKFRPVPVAKVDDPTAKVVSDTTYRTTKRLEVGQKMGDFDVDIDKDEEIELISPNDFGGMEDGEAVTKWIEISHAGKIYWTTVYDFRNNSVKAGGMVEPPKDLLPPPKIMSPKEQKVALGRWWSPQDLPAGVEITGVDSVGKDMAYKDDDADHRLRITATEEELKKDHRVRVEIWGAGSATMYVLVDLLFNDEGKVDISRIGGGKKIEEPPKVEAMRIEPPPKEPVRDEGLPKPKIGGWDIREITKLLEAGVTLNKNLEGYNTDDSPAGTIEKGNTLSYASQSGEQFEVVTGNGYMYWVFTDQLMAAIA